MSIRYIVFIIIFFVSLALFAFLPELNLIAEGKISAYQQFIQTHDYLELIRSSFIPALVVTFSLILLSNKK